MSIPFVRPDVRAYLDALEANPRPAFSDEVVAQMRLLPPEVMNDMMALLDLPVGDLGAVVDVTMPGPDGNTIGLRMFDPRAVRDPGPVIVFYHGGGFVACSVDTHAAMAAELARGLDLPVISVEYRLAPENPWPAAPDDAEAATRWIAENGAAFGREFTGLIPCGDSAGGNLACITAIALRDRPAALPLIMQIPIYPRTDASRPYPSLTQFANGYALDKVSMDYFEKAYAADKGHWRISPILADLRGLPPTLLVTAGLDPLRDEGRAYAVALADAGVDVTYREFDGIVHGFTTYRRAIPSAAEDFRQITGLARHLLDNL